MIGSTVIVFVFRHFCFAYRISRQNSSPGSLAFSHLGNRAEIFLIWNQSEIVPGNRASPVNRAHVKWPLVW